jgi:hypothetical protein
MASSHIAIDSLLGDTSEVKGLTSRAEAGDIVAADLLAKKYIQLLRKEYSDSKLLPTRGKDDNSTANLALPEGHRILVLNQFAIFWLDKIFNHPSTPATQALKLEASNWLFAFYYMECKFKKAIPILKFQIQQNQVMAHYNLAIIYLLLGNRKEEAIEHFSLEGEGCSAEANHNLAILYEEKANNTVKQTTKRILQKQVAKYKENSEIIRCQKGHARYPEGQLLLDAMIHFKYIVTSAANQEFDQELMAQQAERKKLLNKALIERDPASQLEFASMLSPTRQSLMYIMAAAEGNADAKVIVDEMKQDAHKKAKEKEKRKKQKAKKKREHIQLLVACDKFLKETKEKVEPITHVRPVAVAIPVYIDRAQLLVDVNANKARLENNLSELKLLLAGCSSESSRFVTVINKLEENINNLKRDVDDFKLVAADSSMSDEVAKERCDVINDHASALLNEIKNCYLKIDDQIKLAKVQAEIKDQDALTLEEKVHLSPSQVEETHQPILDSAMGNIFYPMNGADTAIYVRFNESEWKAAVLRTTKNEETTNVIMKRLQGSLAKGVLLPSSKAKKNGVVATNETKKFKGGYKVWLGNTNERLPLWKRPATADEQKLDPQIQRVLSLKGRVQRH